MNVEHTLIKKLWTEGNFFFKSKYGPGKADGMLYTVDFTEEEVALLGMLEVR